MPVDLQPHRMDPLRHGTKIAENRSGAATFLSPVEGSGAATFLSPSEGEGSGDIPVAVRG